MKKSLICLIFLMILTLLGAEEKKYSDQKIANKSNNEFSQFVYIQQVLNYTMDNNGKNVELENQNTYLLLKTGMIFELKLKNENKIIKGRWGYQLDIASKEGIMYFLILENPEGMSKEDFLNKSNYTEKAEIILIPVAASDESVTYKIKKSNIDFKSEEIVFKKTIK